MIKLRELRCKNNLKQIDIAQILGVSQSTYSDYETEKRALKLDNLVKLSNIFKVSIDELVESDIVPNIRQEKLSLGQQNLFNSIKQLSEDNCNIVRGFICSLLIEKASEV